MRSPIIGDELKQRLTRTEKKISLLLFAFFSNIHLIFCLVSLNFFQLSFWTAWFELLGALVVDSRGAITVAALRDVNLRKRCEALPRYIVYVYQLGQILQYNNIICL